jgi:uncharacterized protein (TIGR03437 family)
MPLRCRLIVLTALVLVASCVAAQSVSFSVGSASATAGANVSVPISIQSAGGAQPTAVMWTLNFPAGVTSVKAAAGPAAVSAGKSLDCVNASRSMTCVLFGLNTTAVSGGALASVTLQIAASATAAMALSLTDVSVSDAAGQALYETTAQGTVTLEAPALRVDAVASAASFESGIAPGSWITISGSNLSAKTDTWDQAIVSGAFPTRLDGVSVVIGDQAAYVSYVSPSQVNALAPKAAVGTAEVTVTSSYGLSESLVAEVNAVEPAFFQWGKYAVATRQNFSLAVKNGTFPGVTTVPAKPGEVIILWGTGFGPTSPSAPEGVETPSDTVYNTANPVNVTVGGKPAVVYGAALAPGYAGLYQIAIQIPASLADGDYPVVARIFGGQSPESTLITIEK